MRLTNHSYRFEHPFRLYHNTLPPEQSVPVGGKGHQDNDGIVEWAGAEVERRDDVEDHEDEQDAFHGIGHRGTSFG